MISCHLNCICYFCVKLATLKMCQPTRCFAISCHVNCNTCYFYVHIAISCCHVSCNTSYFHVQIAIKCVEHGPNRPKLHILLLCSDCPLIVWSVDLYGGRIHGWSVHWHIQLFAFIDVDHGQKKVWVEWGTQSNLPATPSQPKNK